MHAELIMRIYNEAEAYQKDLDQDEENKLTVLFVMAGSVRMAIPVKYMFTMQIASNVPQNNVIELSTVDEDGDKMKGFFEADGITACSWETRTPVEFPEFEEPPTKGDGLGELTGGYH